MCTERYKSHHNASIDMRERYSFGFAPEEYLGIMQKKAAERKISRERMGLHE